MCSKAPPSGILDRAVSSGFALLLTAFPPIVHSAADSERLGTLFYSPAERVAIAVARSGDAPSEIREIRSSLAINGLVKRDNQKSTVWVNGQAIPEGQAIPPASAPTITANTVTVNGKSVRVGETLDLTSGERSDFIPEGSVSVKRPK